MRGSCDSAGDSYAWVMRQCTVQVTVMCGSCDSAGDSYAWVM